MSGCTCVRCGTCHGLGHIYYESYDEPQDEICYDCDGSGLTEECDQCLEIREQEYDELMEQEMNQP